MGGCERRAFVVVGRVIVLSLITVGFLLNRNPSRETARYSLHSLTPASRQGGSNKTDTVDKKYMHKSLVGSVAGCSVLRAAR